MRPINLIPENERRAHGSSARTGPLAYIVVGSLAVLLIGVVTLVLTGNTISDREAEVRTLGAERASASAQVAELAPYVSFQQVAEQRIGAVTLLADGRFDWARVVRQLSLIIPPTLYLTELSGSATGSAETGTGAPSLTIHGCAPQGQDSVAGFLAALKQIDGVTRVGLSTSAIGGSEDEGGGDEGGGCPKDDSTAAFTISVVFDAAPASPNSAGIEAPAPEAAPEGEEAAEGESEGTAASATTEASG